MVDPWQGLEVGDLYDPFYSKLFYESTLPFFLINTLLPSHECTSIKLFLQWHSAPSHCFTGTSPSHSTFTETTGPPPTGECPPPAGREPWAQLPFLRDAQQQVNRQWDQPKGTRLLPSMKTVASPETPCAVT